MFNKFNQIKYTISNPMCFFQEIYIRKLKNMLKLDQNFLKNPKCYSHYSHFFLGMNRFFKNNFVYNANQNLH